MGQRDIMKTKKFNLKTDTILGILPGNPENGYFGITYRETNIVEIGLYLPAPLSRDIPKEFNHDVSIIESSIKEIYKNGYIYEYITTAYMIGGRYVVEKFLIANTGDIQKSFNKAYTIVIDFINALEESRKIASNFEAVFPDNINFKIINGFFDC